MICERGGARSHHPNRLLGVYQLLCGRNHGQFVGAFQVFTALDRPCGVGSNRSDSPSIVQKIEYVAGWSVLRRRLMRFVIRSVNRFG